MEPTCLVTCDDLAKVTNGVITYNPANFPRIKNTVATYSCTMGLELSGESARTCQNDRTWSGREPYCQRTFVMLGSMPIASNNSAIEITDLGEGDSVQGGGLKCVTDQPSCCVIGSSTLGKWISPNGTAVPGNDSGADIYIDRGMGFIRLNCRNNATSFTGLYCGVIPVDGGGMETFCVNITAIGNVMVTTPAANTADDSIAAYIGGAVAVNLIVCIALVFLVIGITYLALKHRKQNKQLKIQLKELKLVPIKPHPYSVPIQQPTEYEELDQYQESIIYDYVDPPKSNPPTLNYEFSQCPAYRTTSVLRENGASATAGGLMPSGVCRN